MKIAKMANDPCCVPLCNNDKRYESGKERPPNKLRLLKLAFAFVSVQPREN